MTQEELCSIKDVMRKVMPGVFVLFALHITHYMLRDSFAQEITVDSQKRYQIMEDEIFRIGARRKALMEEAMAKLSLPKKEKKFFF